ncbi:membrane protein insertase YidC [Peribacillus kribbensis]|uniref:membrane protein insertase YidC n=1 Tax=Peribacillus kribbensis TaxID=356658 RepID=UPI00041A3AC1|nr:membrane protein insertase YidC [Peribacillus kribbensis]
MNKKYLGLLSLIVVIGALLTGCQSQSGGGSIFHNLLIAPMTSAIEFFASITGGSYGLSIICMTLLIRLVLMPLFLKQLKTQNAMKMKMEAFKPEMAVLQEKMKNAKDPAKQKEYQQEMMRLYQKHGVNPLNMGCLPVLIQMPILMGFYYAIKSSHHIASHTFLWFSLGHPDHILAIVAGIVYFLQFKVSQKNMPKEQQNTMKFMGLMSPLMILIFSFNAPAALPLYWSIGGLFLMLQTEIGQRMAKNHASADKAESVPVK